MSYQSNCFCFSIFINGSDPSGHIGSFERKCQEVVMEETRTDMLKVILETDKT